MAIPISQIACANAVASWSAPALWRFFTSAECESASRRRALAALWRAAKAERLTQSKTWRQFGSFRKNLRPRRLVRAPFRHSAFRLLTSYFRFRPQRVRDGLRQFLPERGRFNLPRIPRIGQKTRLDEHRGTMLSMQYPDKTRPADAAIFHPGGVQQRALQPDGQLQILGVEGVVGEIIRPEITVTARQSRRHSRRRDTIRFYARRIFIRGERIEVQAHEQSRVMRLGERNAVGQRIIRVVRVGEKNLPALLRQQRRQPQRPVQREFLLKPSVQDAVRAAVHPAVARINDDDPIGPGQGQRRPAEQRLQVFLEVWPVQADLAVNDLWSKPEVNFNPVPGCFPAADGQNHDAVGRADRVSGDRLIRQEVRFPKAMLRRPIIQGNPGRDGPDRYLPRSHGRLPFFRGTGRRGRRGDRRHQPDRPRFERVVNNVGIDPAQ